MASYMKYSMEDLVGDLFCRKETETSSFSQHCMASYMKYSMEDLVGDLVRNKQKRLLSANTV